MGKSARAGARSGPRSQKAVATAGSTRFSPTVVLLSVAVAILASALVYLNLDLVLDGTTITSSVDSSAPTSSERKRPSATDEIDSEPVDCSEYRKAANGHFRAGRVQHGLEKLMACAEANPKSGRYRSTPPPPRTPNTREYHGVSHGRAPRNEGRAGG
jgi:hypothetical protein